MALSQWQPKQSPLQTVGYRKSETSGALRVKAITITRSGVPEWRASNQTVAKDHTYYVGHFGVWVHNAGPDCFTKINYHRLTNEVLSDLNQATPSKQGKGQWKLSGENNPAQAGAGFQTQVTGVPHSYAYYVNGVKFDGVSGNGVLAVARRQVTAAQGSPVEWVITDSRMTSAYSQLLRRESISGIK